MSCYIIKDCIRKFKSMMKNFFKVNDFINLRLEDGRTKIIVNGEEFMICKGVAIRIPVVELDDIQDLTSIDNLANRTYKLSEEENNIEDKITLETEFMVHCSNLQVWAENGYDTKLLHSNLAFPLLKRLSEAGDLQAKRIFKEEIVKRYLEGNKEVQKFLAHEGYIIILTPEERQFLFKKNYKELLAIEKIIGRKLGIVSDVLLGSGVGLLDGEIIGLRLYGKKKLSIPYQISSVKSLKKLILKEFIDKELPKWVGKLSNLEYLDLSNNNIEKVPDDLRFLNSLKYLNLGHNKLESLPELSNGLKNLEKIVVSDNRFDEFPKELLSLNNIHTINLSKNNIKSIPSEIHKLINLYDLSVSKNPINTLPDELFSLPKLESLSLPNEMKLSKEIKKKIINRNIPLEIYPHKLI